MKDLLAVQGRSTLQHITPYSPGKPIWELEAEMGLSRIIKLASNENPLGPSPKALEAAAAALSGIHRYPDAGTLRLRHSLSAKLVLRPEQLIVSNGGDELITLVAETFLEPGDEVIVCPPSFSEYEFGAHLMGASIVKVPLDDSMMLNVDRVMASVTPRTRLVCLCTPNNPTGTYIARETMKQLLDALSNHVVTLIDAAYCQYAAASDYTDGLEFVREGYPVIVLQTFSKIYGLARLRVGYGAAPEVLIGLLSKVKEPFNVNAIAQAAATAALEDADHVRLSLEVNTKGKNQLYEAFDNLGLSYFRSMSNFVWVEIGPAARQVYEELMTRGIIVRFGGIWNAHGHLRISVGTRRENTALIQEMTDIIHRLR